MRLTLKKGIGTFSAFDCIHIKLGLHFMGYPRGLVGYRLGPPLQTLPQDEFSFLVFGRRLEIRL
jgi:hypothetical protein